MKGKSGKRLANLIPGTNMRSVLGFATGNGKGKMAMNTQARPVTQNVLSL